VLKDLLASPAMTGAMTSVHDFISKIDMKSSVDVFAGSAPISRDTSSTVTSERATIIVGDFLQAADSRQPPLAVACRQSAGGRCYETDP